MINYNLSLIYLLFFRWGISCHTRISFFNNVLFTQRQLAYKIPIFLKRYLDGAKGQWQRLLPHILQAIRYRIPSIIKEHKIQLFIKSVKTRRFFGVSSRCRHLAVMIFRLVSVINYKAIFCTMSSPGLFCSQNIFWNLLTSLGFLYIIIVIH